MKLGRRGECSEGGGDWHHLIISHSQTFTHTNQANVSSSLALAGAKTFGHVGNFTWNYLHLNLNVCLGKLTASFWCVKLCAQVCLNEMDKQEWWGKNRTSTCSDFFLNFYIYDHLTMSLVIIYQFPICYCCCWVSSQHHQYLDSMGGTYPQEKCASIKKLPP